MCCYILGPQHPLHEPVAVRLDGRSGNAVFVKRFTKGLMSGCVLTLVGTSAAIVASSFIWVRVSKLEDACLC